MEGEQTGVKSDVKVLVPGDEVGEEDTLAITDGIWFTDGKEEVEGERD